MVLRIYSYQRGEVIDVITFLQLNNLVEERRNLGMNEDLLAAFKQENTARLTAWLADKQD